MTTIDENTIITIDDTIDDITNIIIVNKEEPIDTQLHKFLCKLYDEAREDGNFAESIDLLIRISELLTTELPMQRSDRAVIIETVINFFESFVLY